VRPRADVRGEEAVKRARHAADHERRDPREEERGRRERRPHGQPEEVRHAERQPKQHEQARTLECVFDLDRDRMRRKLGLGVGPARRGVRVPVGEEEQVRRRLAAVADRIRGRVAEPARHLAEREAGEPAEQGDDERQAAEPRAERDRPAEGRHEGERGNREDEPERDVEAPLRPRWVDLEVDRVRPSPAEARIRIRREEEVGREVDRVARVRREEAVQGARHSPEDDRRQPGRDRHDERDHPVEHDPHEMGEREQRPEQHREPAPVAAVADDEADGVRRTWHAHARILRRPRGKWRRTGTGRSP
jgi:hypothetical protein